LIHPTVGFIVYGVHKNRLKDPIGLPFIDDSMVKRSKEALAQAGLRIVEHETVLATKEEARNAFKKMKSDDQVDMVVLFSGT
jgi:molybdopterin biosynthesis enzyme MoaB